MIGAAFTAAGQDPWLSQGDLFREVIISRVGVEDGLAAVGVERGPALLMSHDCVLDKKKKSNGREVSRVDFLTFVPIRGFAQVNPGKARALREFGAALDVRPYEALYLGEVDGLGETWVSLAHPYTIPALLLGTELRAFTDAETGDGNDTRLVASIGDTRVGKLSPGGVTLLRKKWMAQWTGEVPKD